MGRTKKVGSSGRYGPRYGKTLKKLVSDIESQQKARHLCPKCKMSHVRRVSAGIWKCKKCGTKFAGAAYLPSAKSKK